MAGEPIPIPLFRFFHPETAGADLQAVLASGRLASGPCVERFEQALGVFIGNPKVIATSDRSGALTLALRLSGVGPGDEVIVPPLVCLGTSMPIANLFAKPVWCDVDPATGMLDPAALAALVSPRTKAVIAYHWGGDVCDLAAIRQRTREFGLKLIDDASAAFGAEYRGHRLGNTGADFTIYSFYAVNQLASADGGALVCAHSSDCEAARQQRRYGIHQASFRLANGDLNPASDIPIAGYHFAMNELTAALGLSQFGNIDAIIAGHRANGRCFDDALHGIPGVRLLQRDPLAISGYWVYALRVERRDALIAKLHDHGIGAQRLHLRNDHYSCFAASPNPLPGVEVFDAENLALPCGWWVDDAARARIVDCIRRGW